LHPSLATDLKRLLEMPSYDHPSAPAYTPGGFAKRNTTFNRNYKISEQLVSVDVDLENREISGYTVITVSPTEPVLKYVKLDCRQLQIDSVLVNGKRAQYIYEDPFKEEYEEFTYHNGRDQLLKDIHQYHFYKSKAERLYKGENTEELTILMPDNLKLYPQDQSSSSFTPMGHTHTPGSHKASTTTEIFYTNVKIRIEYSLKNPRTGLHFVGGKGSNLSKSEWYAYTSNSSYGVSTSSWVPCIDTLWDKCSWALDIGVPKTVKQIGVSRLIGGEGPSTALDEEDEEDESTEIAVIFGDYASQKECAHSIDLAKKSVSIDLYSATSAHHIGFVVGPFAHTFLMNLQEDESSKDKDTTRVPAAVYCLPRQTQDALNTTIFMNKALDFFSKEFGSYPNAGCALVFINDLQEDYNGFCGFTLLNDRLLYPPTAIDPLFGSSYALLVSLAEQWSGIYVVPSSYKDLWVTVGIAHYMALQFIKDLMGVNEYKYRIKKQAEKICELDVGKAPLSTPHFRFPISVNDLDFIRLKAPIVLFILDRRMTKQSFGLSRVFPKIFLQCMSGDLPNGSLSTQHFQHVCEKVNHNRLEPFFRQWIHGSGVPIFRVTQRFNKKRMFIEMGIRQVQGQETEQPPPDSETFISDAVHELDSQNDTKNQHQLFTGPMTIRIHEADGTPYEHIVDLKEGFTRLDIQYNTKYKRLKRSQKQIKSEKEAKEAAEEDDQVLLHCLGDILQSEKDVKEWRLTDWTKEEEDKMTNEAFEWIRIDADFEWICKIHLNQPDYMYASQLQQDRDVEAQLESINYFVNSNPSPLYSSILLRTLMDSRYYYGIRVEAALGMARFAKKETNWISKVHLLKAFKILFCFENTEIPLPNDFSDFPGYFIKKAIPEALSLIRDEDSRCPLDVKQFILTILKYNQNLNNPYTDIHYVGHLIECLASSILANPPPLTEMNKEEENFLSEAIGEISRQQKMDEWTDKSSVSVVALRQKLRLMGKKLMRMQPEDLLGRTMKSHPPDIRIAAYEGLFQMGALKNSSILNYFFLSLIFETSSYLQYGFIRAFAKSLGLAIVEGCLIDLDEDELTRSIDVETEIAESDSGFIVVENGNNEAFESRRDAASRTTLKGSIELLRRHYSGYEPLNKELWNAVRHPLLNISHKRDLFDIISVLIPAYDTFPITLDMPREKRVAAHNLGDGKVVLKREGYLKISLPKKLSIPIAKPVSAPQRRKSISKPAKVHTSGTSLFRSEINRSSDGPLRHVKINHHKKLLVLSSTPFRSKKVKLKLPSENLKEAERRYQSKIGAPRTEYRDSPKPVKREDSAPIPKLKLKFKF
jgi:transcription initiation factor TFIID subunit 2